jgi:hypothetical protein
MSFEPLRDDVEDPCKTLLQTTIWKMLVKDYNLSSSEAISYVANIACFERVPYKLPPDADRNGNQKEFQDILDNTDADMKVIHEQVIKSLPNLSCPQGRQYRHCHATSSFVPTTMTTMLIGEKPSLTFSMTTR